MANRRATVREMTRVSFITIVSPLFRTLNQVQVSSSIALFHHQRLKVPWSTPSPSGNAPAPFGTTCLTISKSTIESGQKRSLLLTSNQKPRFVEHQTESNWNSCPEQRCSCSRESYFSSLSNLFGFHDAKEEI